MEKRYFFRSLVSIILPALWILFCTTACFSQTNVGGLISSNTTWTVSGSPYIVNPMHNVSYLAVQGIQPPFTVELYNEVGQLIRSEVSNSLTFLIYRNHLQPGLYLIRVKKDDTFWRSGKLFIEQKCVKLSTV